MSLGQKQGVMIPQSQLGVDEDGPPMTVRFAGIMYPVQVQWFDDTGRGHAEVWFLGPGDVLYQPPNAESWAAELRAVRDDLSTQVLNKLQRKANPPVPADAVEVLDDTQASP